MPLSVPDEPSPLRQQAYAEGGPILGPEIDPDDPLLTVPRARYNAMLAVLRNTLYM